MPSKLALVWALMLVIASFARPAGAHAVGLSRGEYALAAETVTARLTFARADAEGLDAAALLRGVVVTSHGAPCPGTVEGTEAIRPDGVEWRLRFACRDAQGVLAVRLPILEELPEGHRHSAHLQAGVTGQAEAAAVDDLLYLPHDTVALAVGSSASCPSTGDWGALRRGSSLGMARMGVEHILTGYDHLVFLFGLVLVGGRCRSLLAVVTAFTVAHSMTLAAAALGLWAPPPRIVESAIALSIAYVGIENFFIHTAERRWRVTFVFGLLHGFGFASALRDVAIPRAQLPVALLSFNVGVELGQLAVLAALLPALVLLRRSSRFATGGVRALSGATIALGAAWFVARVL